MRKRPWIDKDLVPNDSGTRYPPPHDEPCRQRIWKRLGDAAGLTQFGVSSYRLAPGVWSSQRHWQSHEGEFVYVLSSELVLVTDDGEDVLRTGNCAGLPGGQRNGHCPQNRSAADAEFLVVGSRNDADHGEYSDIDMMFMPGRYSGKGRYRRKDRTPY